jgi:glutathione S-transferase
MYVDHAQVRRALGTRMADPEAGYAAAIDCIDQIVALLGDDQYMCGSEPSTVDCSLWAHLVHAAATPNPTPLRDVPGQHPPLVAWMLRFGERVGCPLTRAMIHAS